MKKKALVLLTILIVIVGLGKILSPHLGQFLEKGQKEMELAFSDSIPADYLTLFNPSQIAELKFLNTALSESDYPVSLFRYQDSYELLIFKKNLRPSISLKDFVQVRKPLKFNTINTRTYRLFEGFVHVSYSQDSGSVPLDSILITMPPEGEISSEIAKSGSLIYLVNGCEKFNLFYSGQKNPDISLELAPRLLWRKPVPLGLLVKEIDNHLYLVFVLPRDESAKPITKDLIRKLI